MFKDVLQHANLSHWAEAGLLVFFVVFVGVSIWAMTRPKKTVQQWAEIPLNSGEPRRGNDE